MNKGEIDSKNNNYPCGLKVSDLALDNVTGGEGGVKCPYKNGGKAGQGVSTNSVRNVWADEMICYKCPIYEECGTYR